MKKETEWVKRHPNDVIWWKIFPPDEAIGTEVFSFDKKKEFFMFQDYPWNMTEEQVRIFDKENPLWAEFFLPRKNKNKKRR